MDKYLQRHCRIEMEPHSHSFMCNVAGMNIFETMADSMQNDSKQMLCAGNNNVHAACDSVRELP